MIYVGIDPGVKTGFAYMDQSETVVKTLQIHKALELTTQLIHKGESIHFRIEDARKRKWFGKNSNSKQQGAGSIKRDCKIWEDFLLDQIKKHPDQLSFELLHPVKGGTKINKAIFQEISGVDYLTSEHGRDAYMLIHNYKK